MADTAQQLSPCIGVCALDEAEICEGCGRSLSEIAEWSRASAQRHAEIAATARERMKERAANET